MLLGRKTLVVEMGYALLYTWTVVTEEHTKRAIATKNTYEDNPIIT